MDRAIVHDDKSCVNMVEELHWNHLQGGRKRQWGTFRNFPNAYLTLKTSLHSGCRIRREVARPLDWPLGGIAQNVSPSSVIVM